MEERKLILIGGGGHCKSVIEAIESEGIYNIAGILDSEEQVGGQLLGYPFVGTDQEIEWLAAGGNHFLITIGQIKSAAVRARLFDRLKHCKAKLASIVASTAHVSRHATIGEGTVVLHAATINAAAVIGCNNIINTGSNIEHDVVTGNHCHISTHAVLNGDCRLGNDVFIGSNSVLSHGISIADRTVVGAGTVVTQSITEPGIYVGNPAFKIK